MDGKEKHGLIAFYNSMLDQYGNSPETLGWNKKRHNLRYSILLSQWDLSGKQILDFGCGLAYMYDFIKKNNIKAIYTGFDLNTRLVERAKERCPRANFSDCDGLQGGEETYDYIFSSGVHNYRFKDNWNYIQKTFDLFDKHSKCGFAANFLSDKVDFKEDDIYYSNPGQILELCYRYSKRIILRNDYMPFEFTAFISKKDGFDKSIATYPEFEHLIGTESD